MLDRAHSASRPRPSNLTSQPILLGWFQAGNSPEFPALGEGVLGMRSGEWPAGSLVVGSLST